MEIKDWSYEEFPEYPADEVGGATIIETTGDETEVVYTRDVEYRTEGDRTLRLQVLTPRTRNRIAGPLPCIAFVKGSAWRAQKLYALLPQLARIAALGYVVAEVEYRPANEASFPAQIVDAQNAVRYLRLNAGELDIDSERMILAGNSSGGHTALFASFYDAGGSASPGVSASVRGVIDLYGAVSLVSDEAFPITPEHHLPESPEGILMGGVDMRMHPEVRRRASAECQIAAETDLPPVLIAHGTKDRKVNTQVSVDLYRHLRACGKDAELYLIRGADHGVAEFYTDRMLAVYDAFMRRCLV